MESFSILHIGGVVLLEHVCPCCGKFLYTEVIDVDGQLTGDPGWEYCPFCAEPLWTDC